MALTLAQVQYIGASNQRTQEIDGWHGPDAFRRDVIGFAREARSGKPQPPESAASGSAGRGRISRSESLHSTSKTGLRFSTTTKSTSRRSTSRKKTQLHVTPLHILLIVRPLEQVTRDEVLELGTRLGYHGPIEVVVLALLLHRPNARRPERQDSKNRV